MGELIIENRLSRVKVASVYQNVTDGALINRNIDDVIAILNETKTDFVFRGFWKWPFCANTCAEVPPQISYPYDCNDMGYSYSHLKSAITSIKSALPNIIFCGAIPAQRINFIDTNSEIYPPAETEAMALDPAKWNITSITKAELQTYMQEHGTGVGGYFPDITNPYFQDVFLSWAKKQIDCGVDAIWIDSLWGQAKMFKISAEMYPSDSFPTSSRLSAPRKELGSLLQKFSSKAKAWSVRIEEDTKFITAAKESFAASLRMIDEIHNYGDSKGKHIYVGTWALSSDIFPPDAYQATNLDFVTASPRPEEISAKQLNDERWNIGIQESIDHSGDIPIFAFIDWADDNTPLSVFSQILTPEEQRDFLEYADNFFEEKGINFIYPVHGGFMGSSATRLAFGEFKVYDSLAPEFQTYETIKELAQKRVEEEVTIIKCLFPRIYGKSFISRITSKNLTPRLSCLSQLPTTEVVGMYSSAR